MSKKTRKVEPTITTSARSEVAAATESKLEDFAADLGTLLGHAQNKAEGWLNQRKAVAEQLATIRDTASRLLAQLGIAEAPPSARRGRKPGAKNRVQATATPTATKPAKKKRTMSASARKAISDAQKARWAKQKAQGK